MAVNPQVVVEFIAKTDDLKKGFAQAESGATSAGSKLKTFGKAALAAAGAAGLGALVYTLHTGIDEYTQSAKVAAQTNAVLKSTGNAAHVTAQHVDDLAGSLMQKSGVDDEAIKSGENLLLTFTGIRNESGKNNKIFDQATRIMLDMSVALGQDMKSSAIQLGKALNDPVKGMTALQRVGVSFTEKQKEMVKGMVKSGDTIGAQKLILAELNKEFGGSAEAAGRTVPGQLNILKENFNNLAGSIVQTLAPALEALTKILVENPGLAKAVTIGILALAAALVAMNIALAVSAVVAAGIAAPLLIGVAAALALAAAAYVIYTNWNTIVKWFKGAWQTITATVVGPFNEIVAWIKSHWTDILVGLVLGPFALIPFEIVKHRDAILNAIKGVFDAAFNAVWNTMQGVLNSVKDAFANIAQAIWDKFDNIFNAAWNMGQTIVKGLTSGIGDIGNTVWGALSGIGSTIWSGFQTIWQWGNNLGTWIVQGIGSALQGIGGTVWSTLSGIGTAIWNSMQTIYNWGWGLGRKIWDGITGGLKGVASSITNAIKGPINAVISAWNSLRIGAFTIKLPGPVPDVHFGGIDLPNLPYLAAGGIITRPTLAMIGEAGPEAVVPLTGGGSPPVQVHVYIGDVELRGMIRTEVVTANNRTAQTLLAGLGVS